MTGDAARMRDLIARLVEVTHRLQCEVEQLQEQERERPEPRIVK